jgi:hypothetical protein
VFSSRRDGTDLYWKISLIYAHTGASCLYHFATRDIALPIHDQAENSAAKARLIAALKQGRLIGMTGAGLSAWAGYPLWNDALRRLADLVAQVTGDAQRGTDLLNRNPDMLFCAKRLGREVGRERFADFIAREFGPNGRTPPDVLLRFALLPLRHVLTLNFDVSCESAHAATAVPYRDLSSSGNAAIISFFRDLDHPDCPKTIFHLHGKFDDELTNIALTEDGYQRLYSLGSLFRHHFTNLAISRSLLFVGFGFNDNDVTRIFNDSARLVHAQIADQLIHYHFAIIGLGAGEGQEDDDRARRTTMSDRFLTDAVFYNVKNDETPHAEFADLMKEISDALQTTIPVDLQATEPPQDVIAIEDIQRIEDMSEGFLRRIDRGQDDV